MRLINTDDLSSKLETCCDDNYNKFNGSIFVSNTYTYIAWRAQSKPNDINCRGVGQTVPAPTYPYITISGTWTYDEYLGLLIIDNNDNTMTDFRKYKHMNAYAAEDPRLYTKNGNDLYLCYTARTECSFTSNRVCYGLWELKINTDTNVFGVPKQVCKDILTDSSKSIYDHLNWKIYKNFSYIREKDLYLDGFNQNLETYNSILNVRTCRSEKISTNRDGNLSSFVPHNWKIALTTPTILHTQKLFGVAHIRIRWSDLSKNFDQLSQHIQGMLSKNDVHLSDTYFMSVYKIDCEGECPLEDAKWSLSKPFMITGNTLSDEYYSYDVNFPCGIRMNNDNIMISYGVGDCVFLESEVSFDEFDFVDDRQFNYHDLQIHQLNLPIFEKTPIYRALNCNSTIKYILPRYAFLFDLGGSGLKLCLYSFSKSFGTLKRLGYWESESLPNLEEMVDRVLNAGITNPENKLSFNHLMHSGAYALFSLAGTEKLWKPDIRSSQTVLPFLDRQYQDVHRLFQIPEHLSTLQCSDNDSHYYGNIKVLNDIHNTDVFRTKTVLSIPIGTGINMRLTINGQLVNPTKYLWNYDYNGRGIRTSFLEASDLNTVNDILRYIIGESYNDFSMDKIDYIIFSGGGANMFLPDIIKEDIVNEPDVTMLPSIVDAEGDTNMNTKIYVNTDDLCPFKGLIQELSYDKEIL